MAEQERGRAPEDARLADREGGDPGGGADPLLLRDRQPAPRGGAHAEPGEGVLPHAAGHLAQQGGSSIHILDFWVILWWAHSCFWAIVKGGSVEI